MEQFWMNIYNISYTIYILFSMILILNLIYKERKNTNAFVSGKTWLKIYLLS